VIGVDTDKISDTIISATRDIIIRAKLATLGGHSLTLIAGSSNIGVGAGGVWVDHTGTNTGQISSTGFLTISAKDLYATDLIDTDAIRLEGRSAPRGRLL